MKNTTYDEAQAEAFTNRMVTMLNESALALMISIGYQTGLLDTMRDLPAATTVHIADEAKLNERYVREWLGAMVTGKIVEYDPESQQYWLPMEHADSLTRAVGGNNMAAVMPFLPVLATVEKEIIYCFQHGGGVPYQAFPHFHHVMADSNKAGQDRSLISERLPLASGLIESLQAGIKVADIGCGQGHMTNLMAQAFPRSQFVGYDFVEDNITDGENEARQMGLSNIQFVAKDITNLSSFAEYELITAFDVIHDQAQPDEVLNQVFNALKPNGVLFMMDIAASSHLQENLDHFLAPFLYTVSCMHCMTVSLAQDGAGLGTMWGEQKAVEMLTDAGFTNIDIKQRDTDPLNNYYIAYKE